MSDSQNKSGWGCGTLAGWGTFLAGLAAVIGIIINLNDSFLNNPPLHPPSDPTPGSSITPAPQPTPVPDPTPPSSPASTNLTGTWVSSSGYAIVSNQVGNMFRIQSFYPNNLQTTDGTGQIENQQVFIEYVGIDNVPGQVILQLSVDGMQMSGTWGDAWGRGGYVVLVRQ